MSTGTNHRTENESANHQDSWMLRHKKGLTIGSLVVAVGGATVGVKAATSSSHNSHPVAEQTIDPTETTQPTSQISQSTNSPSPTSIPTQALTTPAETSEQSPTTTEARAIAYDPSKPTLTKQIIEGLYNNLAAAVNEDNIDLTRYSGADLDSSPIVGTQSSISVWQTRMNDAGDKGTFSYHISDKNIKLDPTNSLQATVQELPADNAYKVISKPYQRTVTFNHREMVLPNGQTEDIWAIEDLGPTTPIDSQAWYQGIDP